MLLLFFSTVLMAVNATASTGGSSFGCDPHGGERGVCVNGYGNFPTSGKKPRNEVCYIFNFNTLVIG